MSLPPFRSLDGYDVNFYMGRVEGVATALLSSADPTIRKAAEMILADIDKVWMTVNRRSTIPPIVVSREDF